MINFFKQVLKSFQNSFRGFKVLFAERNAKIELAWWFFLQIVNIMTIRRFDTFVVTTILIMGMLAAEAFNTAIEKTNDGFQQQNSTIKKAKDVAATATMLVAFAVIIITVGMLLNMVGVIK